jgi:sorbitol/mannitol transport system substrate-binding protein
MAAALTNRLSVDRALQQSQNSTERFMKHTGYIE